MPVENGSTINDLDSQWPLGGDFITDGDNHLRLIKAILKAQFPGELSNGYATPILATETELNYLQGLTDNVQDQLDAIISDDSLIAPSGTVMVFYQVTPPTGWTQLETQDNAMLRHVSGAGGGAGGEDSPIDLDFTHLHTTTPISITEAQMPLHDFTTNTIVRRGSSGQESSQVIYDNDLSKFSKTNTWEHHKENSSHVPRTNSIGNNEPHDHGDTSEMELLFKPKYIDVISATKD